MKKRASCLGNEEFAQMSRTVLTRADTRAEADVLFGDVAKKARKTEGERLRKLFIQAEASTGATTPSHELQKTASVAPATEQFFQKLAHATMTDAQRRFPELLKVAAPGIQRVPLGSLKKPCGALPVKSGLSGGSA